MTAKEEPAEAGTQKAPTALNMAMVNGHLVARVDDTAANEVRATLNQAIKRPMGLMIHVNGAGTRTIRAGEASKVCVGEVWAYFTLGIYGYRTATKEDRDALLKGETGITCVQLFGPKDTAAEPSEPERKKGFIPRSKGMLGHNWGHSSGDLVMT